MLSGATASAFAMAGTAVFRIVVSSDSMKKATATSHGNNRFTDVSGAAGGTETALEWAGIILPPADYLVVVRGPLSCTLSAHFVENGPKPHDSTKCSTKARDKVG